MSALLAPSPRTSDPRTTRGHDPAVRPARRGLLRPLASPPRRMARLPFLAVLIAAFGLGMAGLLMLNTTLQNQAFEARTLNRQANELTYVQADLEGQLDRVSSPASLAAKASELGMRGNPYPAFLRLPDGKVVGKAKPVKGDELPELVARSPEDLAREQAAAQAKQEQRAQQEEQARALTAALQPLLQAEATGTSADQPSQREGN